MLEGWRVDRRAFIAFRSADFAVLRAGEGAIADDEVEGGVMLWWGLSQWINLLWPQTYSSRLLYPQDRVLEYASFRCWMDNGCYYWIDENRST